MIIARWASHLRTPKISSSWSSTHFWCRSRWREVRGGIRSDGVWCVVAGGACCSPVRRSLKRWRASSLVRQLPPTLAASNSTPDAPRVIQP
jgi:hypothetical protein